MIAHNLPAAFQTAVLPVNNLQTIAITARTSKMWIMPVAW